MYRHNEGVWKRLAGWFGDCAAYEKKPTQVVNSSPSAPLTKGDRYQLGYRRFWESVRDNDRTELDQIFAEGWRIRHREACHLLRFGLPTLPAIAPTSAMVDIVVRFSTGKIICDERDAASYLLDQLTGQNICWRSIESSSRNGLAIIDRLSSMQNNRDFQEAAAKRTKAFEAAAVASRDELVRHCENQFKASLSDIERDWHRSVLKASATCETALKAPDFYPSATVSQACQWAVKSTGLDPQAAAFKRYADRWAKGG